MPREAAGILGGIIGGFIKLVIDQIALAANISASNPPGTVSQVLYGERNIFPSLSGWIVYALITGLVGWIISRIIAKEHIAKFFSSGVIIGVILWLLMNIIFMISGIATPTWSMGIGTFIVNLLSHIVLGIVIVYAISKFEVEMMS